MTLGALIDLGIDTRLFKSELAKLNLTGYDIIIEKASRCGIFGTDVRIITGNEDEQNHHGYSGSMQHSHGHFHNHDYAGLHPVRNLESIGMIIDQSDLNRSIKDFSKKVFYEIVRAEAKVHNKDINEVYFHEIEALDSIVDIVGTAICIDLLGVQKVFSSPLHEGLGFIKCEHGILPVPVPAVMEMLADNKIPLITEDMNAELVTPTGMGIIKCLFCSFGNLLTHKIIFLFKADTTGINEFK